MALVAAAAAAGTGAAALYLDAKYHIKKDLRIAIATKRAAWEWQKAVKNHQECLYYRFEENVKLRGDQDCIWSREGEYSWNQASEMTNRYAQWFLSQGVKPHDLVGFYLQNSPDFIFAWLGLWAIGAAPAMINWNLSGKALVHCVKLSGAKLLLVDADEALVARVAEQSDVLSSELGMVCVTLDHDLKRTIYGLEPKRPDDVYREVVKGDWPMCLFYTSGTTGMPKACSFRVERGFQTAISRKVGMSTQQPRDRWYNCMPMYHGTGGVSSITLMANGTTLCIGKKFSTSKFWGEVRDSRATWITYVGETARYLLAAPPSPLDKEHCVRCMYGNGMRPDVWKKFQERFNIPEVIEFFNSTEGVFALSNFARGDHLAAAVGHHGLISRWMTKDTHVPVLIDPATGDVARDHRTGFAYRQPYETGGEIIVALPTEAAFAGYFNNPEATEKKFVRNVFQKGDLYFRTGDALRRDADGRWFFLDRLGDTFRWKGENVSTAEVSEVLGKFPGIVEANVYGVALPNHDGRAGCAAIFIDPAFQQNFDYAAFLKHARKHLPKYAVPIFIRQVAEMTPIHNNKQNKVPLREEGVDPDKVKVGDKIFWASQNDALYTPFSRSDWEDLKGAKARL